MKYIICLMIASWIPISIQAQSLEDFFQEAAKSNPGLQAKYKEFEMALQNVTQVKSLPDPSFSIGYFISPVETRVGPQRVKLSLSQMFPWFGTLKEQGTAASLIAEAKFQSFLDAQNKLYFQLAVAYYPLYELNKWQEIEAQNAEILQSYKNIATKNFENNKGSLSDVLRVDIMFKDATTSLAILNEKEKPLLTAFNQLLNRDAKEKVQVSSILTLQPVAMEYRRDSILENNPVLKELEIKINASQAQERIAYKQGLPKLGVGIDYVLMGKRTDLGPGVAAPTDNGKNAFMPMVTVSVPIFRKKYRAAVKQAELMQDSYALQKSDYTNSLNATYDMAMFEIQQQVALNQLYNDQIAESNQILNLLLSAYGNSGKDFEEVLRTQQQILKFQKMKATSETQFHIAMAKLNYITAKKY